MDASAYDLHSSLEDRHWWFLGRRRIVSNVLRRFVAPGGRVLEVGCGTGGNLPALAEHYDVVGVESSPEAAERARESSGCPVLSGSLPANLPPLDGRFDAVLLLDVLEHVEHDREALLALKTQLRPGGVLIATVPALRLLWSGHDELFHHFRRYERAQLRELFRDTGYGIRFVSFYNTFLFPPILAARLLKRVTGDGEARSDFELPPQPLNALLMHVFAFEAHLLGRVPLPVGASLCAVATVG